MYSLLHFDHHGLNYLTLLNIVTNIGNITTVIYCGDGFTSTVKHVLLVQELMNKLNLAVGNVDRGVDFLENDIFH